MALADNFSVQGDKIRRGDGGIPAVVHQYDRHEKLIQFVDSVYRDKNFQVDKRFMDIRSVLEQVSCLLYANKIGESMQFCMKNFSAELNRGVESEFKIFILTFLLNVVNNLSNEGNIKLYSRFMNVIKLLNI